MSCLYNFLPLPFRPFINLGKFSFLGFKDVTIPLTEDYAFCPLWHDLQCFPVS